MADVKWIKVCTDIFDDEKILLIESIPDADSVIVIWFKLLCMAGKQNNSGVFLMNDKIAYTDEMLATIFRRPVNTVRLALNVFEQYGMVEIMEDVITIPNWEKHQNLEGYEKARELNRLRQAKHREKTRKSLPSPGDDADRNVTVTLRNALEEEEEKKKIKEIDKEKPTRKKHGQYKNVLLSEADMDTLQAEFPKDWESRIERLSEYMASSGKSYKNHLATIRAWARKEDQEVKSSGRFADYRK